MNATITAEQLKRIREHLLDAYNDSANDDGSVSERVLDIKHLLDELPAEGEDPTIGERKINAIIEKVEVQIQSMNHHLNGPGECDLQASHLKSMIETWRCGLAGEVPEMFQHWADEVDNESDPDWKEYQRLRAKFEG